VFTYQLNCILHVVKSALSSVSFLFRGQVLQVKFWNWFGPWSVIFSMIFVLKREREMVLNSLKKAFELSITNSAMSC